MIVLVNGCEGSRGELTADKLNILLFTDGSETKRCSAVYLSKINSRTPSKRTEENRYEENEFIHHEIPKHHQCHDLGASPAGRATSAQQETSGSRV